MPFSRTLRVTLLVSVAVALAACDGSPRRPPPPPPNTFAFGVFGDGPYHAWEQRRYRELLADVPRSGVEWLVHVGDLHADPCTIDLVRQRQRELAGIGVPVVYTPGDNEWYDCPGRRDAPDDPAERLAEIRKVFYADPTRSLGAPPLALSTQRDDPRHAEFVENARWTRGGFVFATLHLIGSRNGLRPFPGRTAAYDTAAKRRTDAAISWLRDAFALARRDSAHGVVLFLHAQLGLHRKRPNPAYEEFIAVLRAEVDTFPGQVLFVHGDTHEQKVDTIAPNFIRLETYGSPTIGWVRVVMDSVAGRMIAAEPRRMRGL